MKKRQKRILSWVMALCMLLSFGNMPVLAAQEAADGTMPEDRYVIAIPGINKALSHTEPGYMNHTKAEALYYEEDSMVIGDNAEFIITKQEETENGSKVQIECIVNGEKYPFRTESANNYSFADSDKRYDQQEMYIINGTGGNTGTIQATSNNRYATIDNGELRFDENTTADNAEKFLFLKNPVITSPGFSIEHKQTGKYIRTKEQNGVPLTVDGNNGDDDTIFSRAVFGTNGRYVTVSLVSKKYNNGLKSDGTDYIISDGGTNGNGWESIRVIPNGDGTISFKSSNGDKYISVQEKDGQQVMGKTDEVIPGDNEKFYIHTEAPPEPVTGLQIDEKGKAANSLTLSWQNPKCLFTGTEVYQKTDNTDYIKIADLGSEEKYKAKGLEEGVEYTFKVCVKTGKEGNVLQAESMEVTGIPEANNNILQFSEDKKYGIISPDNKPMGTEDTGWQNPMKFEGVYKEEDNTIKGKNAEFIITPQDYNVDDNLGEDEIKVMAECYINNSPYPLKTERNNNYSFADSDLRYNGTDEMYIIKKTGEYKGTIKSLGNSKFAMKTEEGGLGYTENESEATEFFFAEDPEVTVPSGPGSGEDGTTGKMNISLEHKVTGKYIQTKETNGTPVTVNGNAGEEDTIFQSIIFGTNNNTAAQDGSVIDTISFVSKKFNTGLQSVIWNGSAADASKVLATGTITGNGWESVRVTANGDGTISFKDSYYNRYITVKDGNLTGSEEGQIETPSDNEKFIIHISGEDDKEELTPGDIEDFEINDSSRTESTMDLSWKNPKSIFTSIKLYQKKTSEEETEYKETSLGNIESYKVSGLEKGVSYDFKIYAECSVINSEGEKQQLVSGEKTATAFTRAGVKPGTPEDVHLEETADGKFTISWKAASSAKTYEVQRAESLYGTYKTIQSVNSLTAEVTAGAETSKYNNYYRILAINGTEASDPSEAVSLEIEIFGDHTIFFAPTDNIKQVDKKIKEIFDKGNDFKNDAQFKGEQWQIYFKPGDYTETACMQLGFYTSFNGLGKLPTDVRLNNISIPAYLPGGELGGNERNATCNFWRSAENLSVINTGNEQGKAPGKPGSAENCYRPDSLNWAVAQAAPLRRIYTDRHVAYDWNYGWASGGYVADCVMEGKDDNGDGAGTYPGQQFFTRNTEVKYNTYGTTLNNFFMGVKAANNLSAEDGSGEALKNNNGFTNWGIPGVPGQNDNGKTPQQVVTEITSTPKISEKPFLYFDNGEYKIFVPGIQENTAGVSWGSGKENNGMGKGTSLPLSEFYIASPSDKAADINKQIESGKNIYFTPGTYHAEVPILVDRENTILLGTGMASVIPDNKEMAMKVSDLDGIRIEGLIFDAGLESKYLLQVGDEGVHTDHSANPIILQDLFFRVGGTTDVLTKADDALEINSDDVIGDHFWIWRADHGAGVEWYGNESKHGLIVNGDNVNCYALFNEHFQEYHTLWNGENGATYFYQNETCYDPISQEAWMSHAGRTKGYSSYKVSNDVKKHYATGLGIYNVFIYTGPAYDSSGNGIELDNAIEVPNSPDVLVENACIQTFAQDDSSLVKINHIINGVGGSASSGYSQETGISGEGWSRKFLLYYNDGMAVYGKETNPLTFGKDSDERGYFIGLETEQKILAPEDEVIYLDRLDGLIKELSGYIEEYFTKKSWQNADVENTINQAKEVIKQVQEAASGNRSSNSAGLRKAAGGVLLNQALVSKLQTQINKACTKLEAAKEKLIYIRHAVNMQEVCEKEISADDYENNNEWKKYQNALETLKEILERLENEDPQTKKEVYALQQEIDEAYRALGEARKGLTGKDYNTDIDFSNTSADTSKLQELYDKYKEYKETDYTSESWSAFASALANAKAQLESAAIASKEDILKACEALEEAAGKLVKKNNSNNDDDNNGGDNNNNGNNNNNSGGTGGSSSVDKWLESMIISAIANSGADASQQDIDGIIDAIKDISDIKTDLAETEGRADILLALIESLIKNTGSTNAVKEITLDKTSVTLDKGKKVTLKAYILPTDAPNKTIIWNSNNTSVATVTQKGVVKAVKKGTARITAITADGLKRVSCKITVKVPAKKIKLNKKKVYIAKGEALQLKSVMTPSSSTDKIKWKTSKKSVVSVKNGKIKAKKTGTAVITATTSSGKKALCKVYVTKKGKKAANDKLKKKKNSKK